MDVLRSCYVADMHFYQDDLSRVTKVQWYFADERAEALPYNTAFSSRVWEIPEPPIPALGEAVSPRPWRGGLPPYPVPFTGNCGTAAQWAEGITDTTPIGPNWPGSLVPRCCDPPPAVGMGGIGWGGVVLMPQPRGGIGWGGVVTRQSCCADGPTPPTNLVARCFAVEGDCGCWLGFTANLVPYFAGGWIADPNPVNPCGDPLGPWNMFFDCTVFTGLVFSWGISLAQGGFGFNSLVPGSGTCDPFDWIVSADPRPGTGCGPFAASRLWWRITPT